MIKSKRELALLGACVLVVLGMVYVISLSPVEAIFVFPINVSGTFDLTLGDYLMDDRSLCRIVFVGSEWKTMPNGHPVFGDMCQYGSFLLSDYRSGSMFYGENYVVEVNEGGFFYFCEFKISVTFNNITSARLVIDTR